MRQYFSCESRQAITFRTPDITAVFIFGCSSAGTDVPLYMSVTRSSPRNRNKLRKNPPTQKAIEILRIACVQCDDDVGIYDARQTQARKGRGSMVCFGPMVSCEKPSQELQYCTKNSKKTPMRILKTSAPKAAGILLGVIYLANETDMI